MSPCARLINIPSDGVLQWINRAMLRSEFESLHFLIVLDAVSTADSDIPLAFG